MEVVLNSKYLSGAQAATAVLSGEGLLGFWKGNGLNLLRTAPFKAINFFSFDLYHKTLQGSSLNLRGSEVFLAGAMAGVTATVLCFPLDTIRTRMLAPRINQAGLVATVTGMVRREGMASLYAGSLPAVVSMAPAGAVFYGVYNTLKQQHQQRAALQQAQSGTARCASTAGMDGGHDARVEVGVMWGLLYGALAGCASEAVVYPLEVVRRRMQMNGMLVAAAGCGPGLAAGARALHRASSSSRLAMAVQDVMRVRGMRGFYQGVVPNMLQVLPSAALSYQTYELMKELLCVE